MAWATKLPSGRWRAMYRDPDGKQKSAGTCVRKGDAVLAANRAEGIARTSPTTASTLTVSEYLDTWRAQRTVQPSTALADKSKLDTHVLPRWGDAVIQEITHGDVQAWVKSLTDSGLSASTVTKVTHLLSSILGAAVPSIITVNPARGIKLPKPAPSPERFLTTEESNAIREVLYGFDRFIFDLLIGTGMRWGEAVGLTWDRVDLDAQRIDVLMAFDRADGSFKATKSHAARTVPIGASLTAVLANELDTNGWGSPPDLQYRGVPEPRAGLVVANAHGRPYDAALFAKRLDAAARAATVGDGTRKRPVGHVRVHDLRHSYASRLVQNGVPIQQVQLLLGHQTIATTQRYAKLASTQWDSVRSVLDR